MHIDNALYESEKEYWLTLLEQGFVITVVQGEVPDIYFAHYAMRMTSDMMKAMPSAVLLAIKGARELRYAPHGKGVEKGKPKVAKGKKPHKGKHAQVQAEVVDPSAPDSRSGKPATTAKDSRVGGGSSLTVSDTPDHERIA